MINDFPPITCELRRVPVGAVLVRHVQDLTRFDHVGTTFVVRNTTGEVLLVAPTDVVERAFS